MRSKLQTKYLLSMRLAGFQLRLPRCICHAAGMPDVNQRITVDPEICHGKPVVRGLRYPVSMILDLLAAGMSRKEIMADYPDLETEDITACLAFAARLSNVQRILPLAA